jgi:hypothetical protein
MARQSCLSACQTRARTNGARSRNSTRSLLTSPRAASSIASAWSRRSSSMKFTSHLRKLLFCKGFVGCPLRFAQCFQGFSVGPVSALCDGRELDRLRQEACGRCKLPCNRKPVHEVRAGQACVEPNIHERCIHRDVVGLCQELDHTDRFVTSHVLPHRSPSDTSTSTEPNRTCTRADNAREARARTQSIGSRDAEPQSSPAHLASSSALRSTLG